MIRSKKEIVQNAMVTTTIIAMICATLYFYIKYQEVQATLNNMSAASPQETQEVIRKLSKHIQLPQNETPTLVTVSEVEKLREQAFFNAAENGDKVLIYTQVRKAYLYRPRIDKIIEVSTIAINEPVAPANSQSQPIPNQISIPSPQSNLEPTVEIRNATADASLTNIVKSNILAQFPELNVLAETNSRNSQSQTSILVINPSQARFAQSIATKIGAELINDLPPEESVSDADILIIVGTDYSQG